MMNYNLHCWSGGRYGCWVNFHVAVFFLLFGTGFEVGEWTGLMMNWVNELVFFWVRVDFFLGFRVLMNKHCSNFFWVC